MFSIILTRCGAKVGTSEMRTRRKALAKLTSQPERANFMLYLLIYIIYIWSLSIYVARGFPYVRVLETLNIVRFWLMGGFKFSLYIKV